MFFKILSQHKIGNFGQNIDITKNSCIVFIPGLIIIFPDCQRSLC